MRLPLHCKLKKKQAKPTKLSRSVYFFFSFRSCDVRSTIHAQKMGNEERIHDTKKKIIYIYIKNEQQIKELTHEKQQVNAATTIE